MKSERLTKKILYTTINISKKPITNISNHINRHRNLKDKFILNVF